MDPDPSVPGIAVFPDVEMLTKEHVPTREDAGPRDGPKSVLSEPRGSNNKSGRI